MSPAVSPRPRPAPPSAPRRWVRVPVAAALVAVVVGLWGGVASAKGPMPLAPEPEGALMVGRETPVVLRLAWPGGSAPAGLGPDSLDMFGEELPWSLLAVPEGSGTAADPLAGAQDLALHRRAQGVYAASFRPSAPGPWRLLPAVRDWDGRWRAIGEDDAVTRVVDAAPIADAVPTGADGSRGVPWAVPVVAASAVAAALAALALGFARRGRRLDALGLR